MKVDNAVIMAAGTSSRFAPLSYERHKALTVVRGEVLIERQIEQLLSANVPEIYIVTGYKADQFDYLAPKYGVKLLYNPDYLTRNNNSSIWTARDILRNTYVCSADNYFSENPFETDIDEAYYAAEYADGETAEWCMDVDSDGFIKAVTIGGKNAWYMMGHTFWSAEFSHRFLGILSSEYELPETAAKLWENIFISHLDILKMKIRKYATGVISEFDTIDELRMFDPSYVSDTRSKILKKAAGSLSITEKDIYNIHTIKGVDATAAGFDFDCPLGHYLFEYENELLVKS